MAQLDLTIKSDYVDWSVWEGLRELIQNAKDAEEVEGAPMDIDYYPQTERLEITNSGTTIGRNRLVLGSTTKKRDDRQRGQFGEGFKLAFAALLRLGKEIQMDVGEERWRPEIDHSETFDGERLLKVNARKLRKDREHVKVVVRGITEEEWEETRGKVLFLQEEVDTISCEHGKILLDERFRGKIFTQGLYVNETPADMEYGYDLPNVELDRDRRMISKWDVTNDIREVFLAAFKQDDIGMGKIWEILKKETLEADALAGHFGPFEDEFEEEFNQKFEEEYGHEAVPARSTSETKMASHYDFEGVLCADPVREVFEKINGTLQELIDDLELPVEERYGWTDLNGEEQETYEKIVGLYDWDLPIDVVDFPDDTHGTYREKEKKIEISRELLDEPSEFLATLVHEYAHSFGLEDGTVEHRNKTEGILADIALSNT